MTPHDNDLNKSVYIFNTSTSQYYSLFTIKETTPRRRIFKTFNITNQNPKNPNFEFLLIACNHHDSKDVRFHKLYIEKATMKRYRFENITNQFESKNDQLSLYGARGVLLQNKQLLVMAHFTKWKNYLSFIHLSTNGDKHSMHTVLHENEQIKFERYSRCGMIKINEDSFVMLKDTNVYQCTYKHHLIIKELKTNLTSIFYGEWDMFGYCKLTMDDVLILCGHYGDYGIDYILSYSISKQKFTIAKKHFVEKTYAVGNNCCVDYVKRVIHVVGGQDMDKKHVIMPFSDFPEIEIKQPVCTFFFGFVYFLCFVLYFLGTETSGCTTTKETSPCSKYISTTTLSLFLEKMNKKCVVCVVFFFWLFFFRDTKRLNSCFIA